MERTAAALEAERERALAQAGVVDVGQAEGERLLPLAEQRLGEEVDHPVGLQQAAVKHLELAPAELGNAQQDVLCLQDLLVSRNVLVQQGSEAWFA